MNSVKRKVTRVTPDALRSLVIAANLLGVSRICVVQHTDCEMVGSTAEEFRDRVGAASGLDASGWEFLASTGQLSTLRDDIAAITSCALMPPDVHVGGFIFDVRSGELMVAE